jgi:hypothetical protein
MELKVSRICPHLIFSSFTSTLLSDTTSLGEVKVPKGLKSGDSFVFEMPWSKDSFVHDNRGFLDREIVNLSDFFMALAVGLFIGLSIVVGFLAGVLSVTDPNTLAQPTQRLTVNHQRHQQGIQLRMPQPEREL